MTPTAAPKCSTCGIPECPLSNKNTHTHVSEENSRSMCKSQDFAGNSARARQSVVQYWCERRPVIDHDLAQVARVELKAKDWSEDLQAELLAFLGYMDPLSLTKDELQTILKSHSFNMIPENCTAKALFNLNCDQLEKLTRSSTYYDERNRLTSFLGLLFGKKYYPWTIQNPRPGGKMMCFIQSVKNLCKMGQYIFPLMMYFLMYVFLFPLMLPVMIASFLDHQFFPLFAFDMFNFLFWLHGACMTYNTLYDPDSGQVIWLFLHYFVGLALCAVSLFILAMGHNNCC